MKLCTCTLYNYFLCQINHQRLIPVICNSHIQPHARPDSINRINLAQYDDLQERVNNLNIRR